MDHRWGNRLRANLDVRVRLHDSPQAPAEGTLCNLSVSGALIHTRIRATLLSRVMICGPWNRAPEDANPALEGFIVRLTPEGFALEWMDIAPPALESVIQTIVERLGELHQRRSGARLRRRRSPESPSDRARTVPVAHGALRRIAPHMLYP